ncbi:MAG: VOC family protein [Eubacteriales bacterium]|nr:VOC family protein [Eubacteriales bacterium]
MQQLIQGMHHVALKCAGAEEFAKTIAFYHETLGLPIARRWGEGAEAGVMLSAGTTLIEIFANAKQPAPEGAIRHFALATNDVDACVKAVSEAGYEVFVQPSDIAIPSTPVFPARIAFCFGPVGEQIEFFQER